MTRPVDALIEFLHAEQSRGVTHVHLDEGARDGLRELFERARRGATRPSAAPSAAPVADIGSLEETPAPPAPPSPPAAPVLTATTRVERLAELRAQAQNWPPARALGTLREPLVFSTGSPEARLMFIGDAPGYHEEREGEPFVGPAGQKLNDILTKAMGIAREQVYLANILKFRPASPRQTTNTRAPSADEVTACLPLLRAEIEIIRPEVIVALGITPTEAFGIQAPVATARGSWHTFEGIPVRVTHHPAYLLQTGANQQVKRQLWEDMLEVMEKLALPISERQRKFFLPTAK